MTCSIYEYASTADNNSLGKDENNINDNNDDWIKEFYLLDDDTAADLTDSCISDDSSTSSTNDKKVTVRNLMHIMQYYHLKKTKGMNKNDLLQQIELYEADPANIAVVRKRKYMWYCLAELGEDAYFKNFAAAII
jgi:hypothetical protein